jgi:diaminopimelate decarboxylase
MADNILPTHGEIAGFDITDNQLMIGGRSISELADQIGDRAFYVYDRSRVDSRIAALRQALPERIHLHYALKANPMPALVQHIVPQVDGIDVASVREMQIALDAGADTRVISFAGPGKSASELRRAIAAGITLNVESPTELQRVAAIGDELKTRPRVAIRVNPDFELKASGMKMAGGPKPFGIDAEQIPDLLKQAGNTNIEWLGFHIFSGSQNLKTEAIIEAQEKSLALALDLAQYLPQGLRKLNIGGGFGIPYFSGDKPLDIQPIGVALEQRLQEHKAKLQNTDIIIELGRYLVGEAGLYVCRIIDRKISRGQVFLVTNGGLHHHLSNSGNFGQVIRKNYPVLIGNRIHSDEKEKVSIVGPLCTPLDLIADKMELPRADIGDLVVVFQSGAYGLSASPINFLSHPHPAEILT